MQPWALVVVVACAVGVGGCAGSDGMVPVSGEVTFNGERVAEGDLLFLSTEGPSRPEGGRVIDGRYTIRATPGRKKVELRATRPVPGTSNVMRGGQPDVVDYIPARFNSRTELTAEVTPGGPNRIDFHLTAPPGQR
jgi:hypothetical protein